MRNQLNRRTFTGAAVGAVAAASTISRGGLVGANDRVRVGFIGLGNRGCQVLRALLAHKDAQVVALCDIYEPYLHGKPEAIDPRLKPLGDKIPKLPNVPETAVRVSDFRRMLDRNDLDAVFIATPDHWHAIQTVLACQAGKDVYVEKPLSITIHEGKRMVEVARNTKRIVQVGTQRRSSKLYARAAEIVRSGMLGKVTVARAYYASNMYPNGIGLAGDSDPPQGLDWDAWLGPRPYRSYNQNIAPYKFRWHKLYSSQMANWGVHYFDAIRWITGETAPVSISAHGSNSAIHDARDIPDTIEAVFEHHSGLLTTVGIYEAGGLPPLPRGELEIRGTLGMLTIDSRSIEVVSERGGQFQTHEPRLKPLSIPSKDGDLDQQHVRNFLDCIKSRAVPNADIEEGHRSTTYAHLGNIALATRSRIEWDPAEQRVVTPASANDLLHYNYREPWKLG